MQREGQAGHIAFQASFTAVEQQKTGAIARNIVHRIRQFLQSMLPAGIAGGDRRAEAAARHHPRRFGG